MIQGQMPTGPGPTAGSLPSSVGGHWNAKGRGAVLSEGPGLLCLAAWGRHRLELLGRHSSPGLAWREPLQASPGREARKGDLSPYANAKRRIA